MIAENYITSLLIENPNINIVDFAKQYNLLTKFIDISFIDKFLFLVRNDFCIHHDMLYLYDIITDRNTYYIQRLLDQNCFEDGEDYKIINPNVGLNYKTVGRPSINYFLKPKIFKMCLIRSLKTKNTLCIIYFLKK